MHEWNVQNKTNYMHLKNWKGEILMSNLSLLWTTIRFSHIQIKMNQKLKWMSLKMSVVQIMTFAFVCVYFFCFFLVCFTIERSRSRWAPFTWKDGELDKLTWSGWVVRFNKGLWEAARPLAALCDRNSVFNMILAATDDMRVKAQCERISRG